MNQPVTKGDLAGGNLEVINKELSRELLIDDRKGALQFRNMLEVMEFAKIMATAGTAVPPMLRGNPGSCLAICVQAAEWHFSPFAVASKAYEVNGRIAFESQLIHAVIESRAPLMQRLRCEYEGEGDERVCIVTGHIRGEVDPLVYRSPKFGKILPKNSPLWKVDPDQQQWYFSSRGWCRRYTPDVLLGVYSKDEMQDNPPDDAQAADAGTDLHNRLIAGASTRTGEGFTTEGIVEAGLNGEVIPPETKKKTKKTAEPKEPEPAQEQQAEPAAEVEQETVELEQPKQPEPEAPKPAAKAKKADALPGDAVDYAEHVRIWIAALIMELRATKTPDAKIADRIEEKWTNELPLRRKCKVGPEAREDIQAKIVKPALAELAK